jgi:two-component system phosphate regulon sensor histidine kinase PhoR
MTLTEASKSGWRAPAIAGAAFLALAGALWSIGATSATIAVVLALAGSVAIAALAMAWRRSHARLVARLSDADRTAAARAQAASAEAAAAAAMLEALPDPVLQLDEARIVVAANAAARDLLGVAVGREITGSLRDPDLLAAIDDQLAGHAMPPVALTLPGAVERHFEVRFAQPARAAGARVRLIVAFQDVTALRRIDAMRADFVANVSHELRTPLTSLLGFVETLRGPAKDDAEARERFLAIMHADAQRMTRLVADLLSLSRIEASEHTRPTKAVELLKLLAAVIDTAEVAARARGMTIELVLEPDLATVIGDADQLQQVFQNLVDNAVKYGRPQTPIRVEARRSARMGAAAGHVAVTVRDQGEGIAREHLPRLTERFYRVDAGRSRRMGGTGLGLAIVKHIVNRHRGALTIESELGRGSSFTVHLPVHGG